MDVRDRVGDGAVRALVRAEAAALRAGPRRGGLRTGRLSRLRGTAARTPSPRPIRPASRPCRSRTRSMTGEMDRPAACQMTDSEWAPQPWSAETTRPSSGAYALAQAPNSRPSSPLSGTKNPQLTQCAGAAWASGVRGPCSLAYQRSAALSRPDGRQDARPPGRGQLGRRAGPASCSPASPRRRTQSITASSPSRVTSGMSRSSSGGAGSRSPTPRSPGRSRSCHGTQSGASRASGPGSRTVSSTVTTLDRGARATVTAHRQPT